MFGGGCFWCTEAAFERVKGVVQVTPGYAGGREERPTYESVSAGETGHAEVIRVEYDPAEVNYRDLLTVFFAVHDPTTRNRQGNDIGPQYRSVILYATEEQQREAERMMAELDQGEKRKIVTQVEELEDFYPAEAYHRQYYRQNPSQAYCQIVISPKLKKLQERYARLLKAA